MAYRLGGDVIEHKHKLFETIACEVNCGIFSITIIMKYLKNHKNILEVLFGIFLICRWFLWTLDKSVYKVF